MYQAQKGPRAPGAQGGKGLDAPSNGNVLSGSGGDIVIDQQSPFADYDGELMTVASGKPTRPDPITTLKPAFRAKVEEVLIELEQQGWEPRVAEGLRTPAEQAAKLAAGTSRTLDSAHVKGYGADIVDRRWGWSGPAAKHSFRFWHDLGAAAQRQGLTWGGAWKTFPDPAHVEMKNWRSLP